MDARLTEERLRNHLDGNQPARERLCLAIMPLLGPYTREQPRCPKGGPDGGRDIEAVYQGSVTVWGAVGFRNGGGNDASARRDAQHKFRDDLDRALSENPSLQGFVFFTNIDLTPGIIDQLKREAFSKGVSIVDIFDVELLRHALDSPEGLIARLQYLDIEMSKTEQISLVSKFGNELQQAVLARFDRVERTLSQMERFLAFQKPLFRLDVFVSLNGDHCSADIGDEAILLDIDVLHDLGKHAYCLCVNRMGDRRSHKWLMTSLYYWQDKWKGKVLIIVPSLSPSKSTMASFFELSLTTGGHRVRIADLTWIKLRALCTSGIRPLINHVTVDANGYEIFNSPIDASDEVVSFEFPEGLPFDAASKTWVSCVSMAERNLIFDPPSPSGRMQPLRRV